MAAPETDFESGAAFSLKRVKCRYDSIGEKSSVVQYVYLNTNCRGKVKLIISGGKILCPHAGGHFPPENRED